MVWGTWEEMILAGAVLRHGTQAWDVVSSELRARTIYPFSFTPETCEAKYKVLQQQYIGCQDLFEDLKKKRVAELRKELEKSDDSIGSLESKLENLKESHSQIGSPTPVVKSEGNESFGKDSSKDGLSAGSFTQDITKISEKDPKLEISGISHLEKTLSIKREVETNKDRKGSFKKKRGGRKRKDCNGESKGESNAESENVGSTNFATSTTRTPGLKNPNIASTGGNDYLMRIFNSVAENDVALVFRRKLDSQKRARYRKIIRRHLDFDTLRSRIATHAIPSVKELFRDLLLLANNALVFYSKRTREYKTALLLRDMVTNSYRKHCRETSIRSSSSFCPLPEFCNIPVKPRSVRPHPHKFKLSTIVPVDNIDNSVDEAVNGKTSLIDDSEMGNRKVSKTVSNISSNPSIEATVLKKKGVKRTGKVVRGSAKGKMTEKKRSRRK